MNGLLAGSSRWTRRKLRGRGITETAWNLVIILIIIGLSTVLLRFALLILVFRDIANWIFSGLGLWDGLMLVILVFGFIVGQISWLDFH